MVTTYFKQILTKEMKTTYEREDFQVGMLIEAIIDNRMYHITGGEAYEIVNIFQLDTGPAIYFINDTGASGIKIINSSEYPFNTFFKIL